MIEKVYDLRVAALEMRDKDRREVKDRCSGDGAGLQKDDGGFFF